MNYESKWPPLDNPFRDDEPTVRVFAQPADAPKAVSRGRKIQLDTLADALTSAELAHASLVDCIDLLEVRGAVSEERRRLIVKTAELVAEIKTEQKLVGR